MMKGMINVSVLHANEVGKNFNTDYYLNTHIPLVANTLGDALIRGNDDKGVTGGESGSTVPLVAIANLLFDSMEEFTAAFSAGVHRLMADLPNFTNIEPVIQINEVIA